jgi:hypothetical protein
MRAAACGSGGGSLAGGFGVLSDFSRHSPSLKLQNILLKTWAHSNCRTRPLILMTQLGMCNAALYLLRSLAFVDFSRHSPPSLLVYYARPVPSVATQSNKKFFIVIFLLWGNVG